MTISDTFRIKMIDSLLCDSWDLLRRPSSGTGSGRFAFRFYPRFCQTKKPCFRMVFCLVRPMGLEPIWLPTRPSNVRVCLFRHGRINISKEYYRRLLPKSQLPFLKKSREELPGFFVYQYSYSGYFAHSSFTFAPTLSTASSFS